MQQCEQMKDSYRPNPEILTNINACHLSQERADAVLIPPQACSCQEASSSNGDSVKAASYSYTYALGQIEARFPMPSVEKECAQVVGRADTKGLTHRETLHSILSKRENRYLARLLCWVFTIEGLETYLLVPRDPVDFEALVEAIRPAPRPTDLDAVIGVMGPIAPPEMCSGLMVPIVGFDQLYCFDIDALIKSIPKPLVKAGFARKVTFNLSLRSCLLLRCG
jgi:hypothetical protein